MVGEGPGAGGGAELLAGGEGLTASTQQETVLGVVLPLLHQPGGHQARGGRGGEEHLRGLVSIVTTGDQDGCRVVRPIFIIMNYDDILTHRPQQPRQNQAGGSKGPPGRAGGDGGTWSLGAAPGTAALMQTVQHTAYRVLSVFECECVRY